MVALRTRVCHLMIVLSDLLLGGFNSYAIIRYCFYMYRSLARSLVMYNALKRCAKSRNVGVGKAFDVLLQTMTPV